MPQKTKQKPGRQRPPHPCQSQPASRQNVPRPPSKRPSDRRLRNQNAPRSASFARWRRSRRTSPRGKPAVERKSFERRDAYVWHPDGRLAAVPRVSRVELFLLKGIDRMRDILMENTERFANGLPANNALLWGARGMGKSSLVKAAHASINAERKPADKLKLIEIHREDIESLPALMEQLRASSFRFIVFCDDLSFDGNDASYKSLKAVLEGGIEGRPENVILYATSNRRHLLAREMIENERSTAINPGEAVEEKVSLSDRFGLWLGFHRCSQDEYLAMVRAIAAISASRSTTTRWNARRWNGRRRAVRARAASPGSSCRSLRAARREAGGDVAQFRQLTTVIPRAGGESSTPRLLGSTDCLWIVPLSRAMTAITACVSLRLTPRSGIEAGQPGSIPYGSRSGAAATPPPRIDPTWQ